MIQNFQHTTPLTRFRNTILTISVGVAITITTINFVIGKTESIVHKYEDFQGQYRVQKRLVEESLIKISRLNNKQNAIAQLKLLELKTRDFLLNHVAETTLTNRRKAE